MWLDGAWLLGSARLIDIDWEVQITHIYREANKCVDALVNVSCEHKDGLVVYESTPVSLYYNESFYSLFSLL